ncbi:6-phosphogluconolactonase [Ectothiorhodospiraceae bacterium 2226]|nr:6-phosphogluconolactonase [Ectothiorhodospiraceae bacterium 2226]
MPQEVRIFDDAPALAEAAARFVIDAAQAAVAQHGRFHWVLSGGGTPRELYATLARPEFSKDMPWTQVYIYFGDERCVPPDHEDSNYRMTQDAMLRHVPIPPDHVLRFRTEAEPAVAAREYEEAVRASAPRDADNRPVVDLTLLGVGKDGHTASLFPGTPIMNEQQRLAAEVYVDKLQAWRVSLTLPVFHHARAALVLAAGESKADVVYEALHTEAGAELPIRQAEPRNGEVSWYLDRTAGARLGEEG